ncbi:glycoside hydrolase [Antarcticibacterium flavum]|uniref:Glycoside hydrolase n=1 Tax=Antarcticibacterium flavum TaxID=2058175 RepID=A0A5B7X3X3_9FLAO|nr:MULTISPECIES: isoamylase early set domain-containing protein [Antarcticibacterium]MCM4161109.1 glycoside hydrolase [Antarcticibacterium sp. W02-3]QCY69388.1 glycoside hydrolase [Antarcticibacterium flavum]
MAIQKKYLKSKPVCKVTFVVPAEEAKEVSVVGDFNEWDPAAHPLKKQRNGNFKGTFDLQKDKSYEFKYLIDGNYTNEPEADSHRWNDHAGAENPVLEV